jgi:fibronectin type 3 domain-containing protein
MSECWSYKQRESELGSSPAEIYARDVFSFWAPIDVQFLDAMVNWAYWRKLEFMTPYWTQYLRSYIDYDATTSNLPPADLFNLAWSKSALAMRAPATSPSGVAYNNFLANPVDTVPPSAPIVTSTSSRSSISLQWTATDNVGVYKYVLDRPGFSNTTVYNQYTDRNLTDGTCYDYTITAYDFKGNNTATPYHACTNDATPPTPPTVTTVTPGPVVPGDPTTTSMTITWAGATDNVGIKGYVIYKATDSCSAEFAAIAQVPATPTTYVNSGLQRSSTLFCYRVKTQDQAGFYSDFGPVGSAVSPDWLPPSIPRGVTASGAPQDVTVNWSPSTDDSDTAPTYEVRRTTESSITTIASGLTRTSYVDRTITPSPDTVPPDPQVYQPQPGSTVSRTIAFSCNCKDKGVTTVARYAIRAVDASNNASNWSVDAVVVFPTVGGVVVAKNFYVDGVLVNTITDPSINYFPWDTRTVPNGPHTLTIQALDAAGNVGVSVPAEITVAN